MPSRARVLFVAVATLAALLTATLAVSQTAEASSHLTVQGFVNGHADSPKYELHGDWVVGESITVEIWDTAAKGAMVFTETFVFDGALGPRGTGSSEPGNHFVVTQGSDTLEFSLLDIDLEIDGIENTVTGSAPVGAQLALDPPSDDGWCHRELAQAGDGSFATDFDDPVDDPENPGCSPTWDPGPGDRVKITDNSDLDGADCCQTVIEAQVVDFGDDDGSTFELDITWLAQEGITRGCNPPTNDMFCPDKSVTRGQMAAFLVRALELTDDGGGDLFSDDDGSTFEADIDKLATAGITRGCNPPTNDMFCPDSAVTRGQMAAFLRRALG